MSERPILFSTDMVRAILEGHKTQTRRVIKPQPTIQDDGLPHFHREGEVCLSKFTGYPLRIERHPRLGKITMPLWCPYGEQGDRLWVRETFNFSSDSGEEAFPAWVVYKTGDCILTDGQGNWMEKDVLTVDGEDGMKWRPAIYMPRWAARLILEVVNVRVERLQDITEGDAVDEGFGSYAASTQAFIDLWERINGKRGYGWDANPLVWVIEFKNISPRGESTRKQSKIR